jgi:cell pole-organizing protein PopZ
MPETKPEQDASIEEILKSIRQIINEDEDAPADTGGADLRPKPETIDKPRSLDPIPEEMGTGGVLDLTEKVEDLSEATDMLGEDLMNPDYDPDPPPLIDLQDAPPMNIDDQESLLSDRTADAAAAEMAKLLSTNVAVERDEPARIGRLTLEDMARDLMRPLIKTWLDENLPRVIEKVVTREMEKLARRARDE